jgi:phage tail-like protein
MAKFGRDALAATTKTKGDFNLGSHFNVEIDGITIGGIHKVDGLEFHYEVVKYHHGDELHERARPGNNVVGKFSIEKDWTSTKEFFNWRDAVAKGQTDRRSISIVFFNDAQQEAKRINLFNCFPIKWTGPSLNAGTSQHASERLDIVYEGVNMT